MSLDYIRHELLVKVRQISSLKSLAELELILKEVLVHIDKLDTKHLKD